MRNEKPKNSLAEPRIDRKAWIAPDAVVLGDVRIAAGASVWYGAVVRGDLADTWVEIGEDTNIQDGSIIHVDIGQPCRIGARVTVGHRAVVHAATIEDESLIGMGAIVLSGAKVGKGAIVAAGAVVSEGVEIPAGKVAAGVPAKVRREATDADRSRLARGCRVYTELRDLHKTMATRSKRGTDDQQV